MKGKKSWLWLMELFFEKERLMELLTDCFRTSIVDTIWLCIFKCGMIQFRGHAWATLFPGPSNNKRL